MDLENQIRQMNNSQEFVKLVNTLFTAKYKDDFQVIDGARADGGNDGYIKSEKRLLAIYCPVKPENKTDKRFISKITSDSNKAKKLNDSGELKIEKWTFVTPSKISHKLIVHLNKKAKEANFEGNHLEATYLADELYKNQYLLQKFPYLYISRIEMELEKINSSIEELKKPHKEYNELPVGKNIYKQESSEVEPTEDANKVFEILQKAQTQTSKDELRAIFYKATDKIAQINAILGLLHWYDPLEEKIQDMIEWCNNGIRIAEMLKSESLKAIILSYKGSYLSTVWAKEDTEMAFAIKMSNLIGLNMVSEEQRENKIKELYKIEDEFSSIFKEAVNISIAIKNANILAQVCLNIGYAAGTRYIHLNTLGVARANSEKALSKKMILIAKDLLSAIGDELGVGYALHNLAIQLHTFGENKEAAEVNKAVIEIAKKYNNESLLQTAGWLEETLKTGKIPDYVHGERRERRK